MTNQSNDKILAGIQLSHNPDRPTQSQIHGTGRTDGGWTVRPNPSGAHYQKKEPSTDIGHIQRALIEFWRKLATEVGASCAVSSWNVLAVEATMDFGKISGTASRFFDRTTKRFDTGNIPCPVNVTLTIPLWETMWYGLGVPGENAADWEREATHMESTVYDQIQNAAWQEPALTALIELRKRATFEIWVQPHDSPTSGRFIEIPRSFRHA